MDITPAELFAEVARAQSEWPFLWGVEQQFGLPRGFLMAIGSRETNLTDEVGDGGHGWGVFQLDNRSHVIPPNFLGDVPLQAQIAAQMLSLTYAATKNWKETASVYNSGQTNDQYTTGHNYGVDVMARLQAIQLQFPPPVSPVSHKETKMICATRNGIGYWCAQPDGAVDAFGVAGYHGGANAGGNPAHPATADLSPGDTVIGIAGTPDDGGYWLLTQNGAILTYGNAPYEGGPNHPQP